MGQLEHVSYWACLFWSHVQNRQARGVNYKKKKNT